MLAIKPGRNISVSKIGTICAFIVYKADVHVKSLWHNQSDANFCEIWIFSFFSEEQTTICSIELSLKIEISVELKVNSIILDHSFATIEKHPLAFYDQLSMITNNCCGASIIGEKPSKFKQTWINKSLCANTSFIHWWKPQKFFNAQRCFEKIELKNSSLTVVLNCYNIKITKPT